MGNLRGFSTRILAVKDKPRHTPGTKNYTLNVRGVDLDFKANVLELIEKSFT
jgi:hypothetical protein